MNNDIFLPIIFADKNDLGNTLPFAGHAGFILVNSNGTATYYEYGPTWDKAGTSSKRRAEKRSAFRHLSLLRHGAYPHDHQGRYPRRYGTNLFHYAKNVDKFAQCPIIAAIVFWVERSSSR